MTYYIHDKYSRINGYRLKIRKEKNEDKLDKKNKEVQNTKVC